MKYSFIKFNAILFIATLLMQCQREREEYFKEPEWVGKSIYETLQDEGNFSKYLKLADKTLYSISLKGNGLWTVFAPNDAAVDEWLAEKNYSSVDDVSEEEANKIVAYSMIYNKYAFNQLSDILYQGWDTIAKSVRKRTPYYETLRREYFPPYSTDGTDSIWVVDANMVNGYSGNYNNYKFLPFYMERFFNNRQIPLTADDYNIFYNTPYTGKNVQRASVIKADIHAKNGYIHEIDHVNEPLPTIEQLLNSPDYSKLKAILDMKTEEEPYFYSYNYFESLTNLYKTLFPLRNIDRVYYKWWSLPIRINTEMWMDFYGENPMEKDTEMNGWTIFAPNNDAVDKFYDEVLKEYYPSIDDVPLNIWNYFVSSQMAVEMIWPTEYPSAKNEYNDFINGMGLNGPTFDKTKYIDIKPASNGFFFGSNDYVKNRNFETVFSEILLRSESYTMMYNALNRYFNNTLRADLVKCQLNGYTEEDYTVLLISDRQFQEDGFRWEWTGSQYSFNHDGFPDLDIAGNTGFADERMYRLISSHVFKRLKDNRITDFAGDPDIINGRYDGWVYAVNDYGDMVRYKDGQLEMLGNTNLSYPSKNKEPGLVTATHVKTFMNGQVFTVDKMLEYPLCGEDNCNEQSMLYYIREACRANRPSLWSGNEIDNTYWHYMRYLMGETIANDYTAPVTLSLSKQSSYTILMPSTDALRQAIADGRLRPLSEIMATANNGNVDYLNDAIDFFKYHIIPGTLFVDDGALQIVDNKAGIFPYMLATTALKVNIIDPTFLRIEKQQSTDEEGKAGDLLFISERSAVYRKAKVASGLTRGNVFGFRAVLHEIDNYLYFEPENQE